MSVSLTVMTFNLHEDQPSDSPNVWEKRRDLCISVITSYSPMILCTQQGIVEIYTLFDQRNDFFLSLIRRGIELVSFWRWVLSSFYFFILFYFFCGRFFDNGFDSRRCVFHVFGFWLGRMIDMGLHWFIFWRWVFVSLDFLMFFLENGWS